MNRSTLFALLLTAVIPATTLQAADANAEQKLREALRNALIQARTAQNEKATADAEKAEVQQKADTLTKQVEGLTKQLKEDKESSDRTIGSLKKQSAEQAETIAKLNETLASTQTALKASQAESKAREEARQKLADQAILNQRTIDDQKNKNFQLYSLGKEILRRYEKFGLGEALGAKEPFIGTTRVKIESFVQDFQDKIDEQKIKPATKP